MNAVAFEDEPPSYAPDRTVALLLAAFRIGMFLIWAISVARVADQPNFAPWARANAGPIGEHVLSDLYTLWLCAAIHQGRRWALVGLSFQCVRLILQDLISGGSLQVLMHGLVLGYCLLRLSSVLGPKPTRHSDSESFVPDRLVAATLAVLDIGTVLSFLLRPLPGHRTTATTFVWFICILSEVLWFQWSVFKSRGWAIGVGFIFTAMGYFIQVSHPEQRLQRVEAILGFLYFGFRLVSVGPRPKGFLGIASR